MSPYFTQQNLAARPPTTTGTWPRITGGSVHQDGDIVGEFILQEFDGKRTLYEDVVGWRSGIIAVPQLRPDTYLLTSKI